MNEERPTIVCSYCDHMIYQGDSGGPVAHGICSPCYEEKKEEWKEWLKNPDDSLRRLERAIATDDEDPERLWVARSRRGLCTRCGAGEPEPGFRSRRQPFAVSWAIDDRGYRMCHACAAKESLERVEAAAYGERLAGYVPMNAHGGAYHTVVTTFTGAPLIWGRGEPGTAGFGGRSFHWHGRDRWGREWWGRNSGPGALTRMRLYKRDGEFTGRKFVERRSDRLAPPSQRLREAQDAWLVEHGAGPLPVRFNSDQRLRRLERAAAAGDPEARSRLHRERIRSTGRVPMTHRLPMRTKLAEQVDWWRESGARVHLSRMGPWGVIPHSELAMHSRAAGRPALQYALIAWDGGDRPTSAAVLYESDNGLGWVLRGRVGEVLPDQVRRTLGGFTRERMPLANPGGICPVTGRGVRL